MESHTAAYFFLFGNLAKWIRLVSSHQEDVNVTYVGRYALLPVTSTENPLLNDIQKKEAAQREREE